MCLDWKLQNCVFCLALAACQNTDRLRCVYPHLFTLRCRYVALSFTVIGTLVDLFPEMLLLTEIVLHPGVLLSPSAMGTILRLMFSDGKPVIVFAANDEDLDDKPLNTSLKLIRDSLRRRLASIAASLFFKDGCTASHSAKWTYAGLVGILVGGELLTAIGASLFLRIEFGWPAVISLIASLLALLISVRCHMRILGEKKLHMCSEPEICDGGRLVEFLLPGPMTFARFLLMVPVWPMLLVYSENASFWPFSMAAEGDHSLPASGDAMWVNPKDWFRVAVPSLDVSDNGSPLSYIYWAIVPHLLWALIATVWTGLFGVGRLFYWYFGHSVDWSMHSWGAYFASQASPFHVWSSKLQGALGLGFTAWVTKEFFRLFVFSVVLAALLIEGFKGGPCLEQEWAFLFAHVAWWGILLIGQAARKKNVFRTISNRATVSGQYWERCCRDRSIDGKKHVEPLR